MSISRIKRIGNYVLLFLTFVNFANNLNYLLVLTFLWLFLNKKISVRSFDTLTSTCFIIFCFTYIAFGSAYLSVSTIPSWACAFVIGYSIVKKNDDVLPVLSVVALGLLAEGVLTIFLSPSFTMDSSGDRFFNSIWNGQQRPGTAQDCSFYMYSACAFYLAGHDRVKLPFKVFFVVLAFYFVFDSLVTATRSVLLYCTIILFFAYFIKNRITKFSSFSIVIFFIVIIYVCYLSNVFGIKTIFGDSFLFQRIVNGDDGGVMHNSRLGSWNTFFDHWMDFPLGGLRHANKISFMHNILLDTYASAGIFTSLALLIIILRNLLFVFRSYRRSNNITKYLLPSCFLSFILVFNSEPIIESSHSFFAAYLFFVGVVCKYNSLNNI